MSHAVMGFFKKNRISKKGRLIVCLQKDGVYTASVERQATGLPIVTHAAFFPVDQPFSLPEHTGKELSPGRHQFTHLLNAGEYQILSVEAPNVVATELRGAIRWRLKDLLDYPVDDATIDILEVPSEKSGPARNNLMFAIVARNQLIRQRQAVFEQAGIPLTIIDIPEMAQRNISVLLQQEQDRGVALLSFDDYGGLLTITCDGELYLARRLDISLQQIQQGEVSADNYERVTVELQRSFDHFDRQYRHITLSRLVLAPTGNADSALHSWLSDNLDMPVKILDLQQIMDFSRVPTVQQPTVQQRYFLLLGAALRTDEGVL